MPVQQPELPRNSIMRSIGLCFLLAFALVLLFDLTNQSLELFDTCRTR